MQRQAAQQGGTPLTRWIRQYFPELLPVVKGWQGQGTLWVLDHLPLPEEMGRVGVEWIPERLLGATAHRVRRKPARALGQAAAESIGVQSGLGVARHPLRLFLSGWRAALQAMLVR
jgi:hypothetical protein